jgi:hypothetical protein
MPDGTPHAPTGPLYHTFEGRPEILTSNQPNAMTDPTNFRKLRDYLYKKLVDVSCVPKEELDDDVVTEQLEKRFFPAGTAAKVLTSSRLERLFTLVTATGHPPLLRFQPAQLAQQIEVRDLHNYVAILITSKCDIEPLISFTETLVATRTWSDTEQQLAALPVHNKSSVWAVIGDDVTADIFFQKQHDFFAPIIVKNKEVRGQFRRLPYVRQKLIGEGSFGKIYKVVVRSSIPMKSHP